MIKRLFIVLIKLYQKISGLFPRKCRFYPTCSQYMLDAVNARGLPGGLSLGVRRIIKCHPFNIGGYDPVILPGNNKGKVIDKVEKG